MSVEVISAVLHNSKAKGTTKLVLIGIANHEGDGGSWPSIETLCKYANCGRTQVKKSIKELKDMGELEVLVQQGGNQYTRDDKRPNLYRVLVPPYVKSGGHTGDRRKDERGSLLDERGSLFEGTGVTRVTPNRPIEPSLLEPSIKTSFEVFWENYPRHSAKPKAREAFEKAIYKGISPAKIIEAAARFADDPNRQDAFTPLPATWLNQERWDDDALPELPDKRASRLSKLESMQRRLTTNPFTLKELP